MNKRTNSLRKKNRDYFNKTYKEFIQSIYDTEDYISKDGRFVIKNTELYGTITYYPGSLSFQEHGTDKWHRREGITALVEYASKKYYNKSFH